jgi:hypothetical protein
MQLEDFKTWHWMVLGPIIGLIYGGIILFSGSTAEGTKIETIDQGSFERAVSKIAGLNSRERYLPEYAADRPWIKNLVVHPPLPDDEKTYWVMGKIYTIGHGHENPKDPTSPEAVYGNWDAFRYEAKMPYHAANGAPGIYPTVMAYLDTLKKNSPDAHVVYRFAWWDATAPTLILPAMAGFLIIGVAWPMAMQVMQGAGLAPVPQPKVKLPKNRKTVAKAAVDHSAGDQQLDELNTQMEEGLAAGASSSKAGVAMAAVEAPVKVLNAGPEAITAAVTAAEKERMIREYGGEFYPVVKKVHKESEDDAKT